MCTYVYIMKEYFSVNVCLLFLNYYITIIENML